MGHEPISAIRWIWKVGTINSVLLYKQWGKLPPGIRPISLIGFDWRLAEMCFFSWGNILCIDMTSKKTCHWQAIKSWLKATIRGHQKFSMLFLIKTCQFRTDELCSGVKIQCVFCCILLFLTQCLIMFFKMLMGADSSLPARFLI
jgi:hypothetical protein